jgi:hypothetical protein
MNKPHLLLVVLLAATLFSCGERRKQKKEARRGFTWEVSGEEGTVLVKDIRSLLKKHPLLFGDRSILETYSDTDTAGRFVREGNYLWMALYTTETGNALGYLCAKKEKTGYKLVLADAGSEFFENCTDEISHYLEKAGPFILFHQPVNDRPGCGSAPEIFRIDGTEIQTNDLKFYWRYCDDFTLNGTERCFDEKVRFVYEDGQLQSVHEREEYTDRDPTILSRRKYKVRYTIRENDLRIRDTLEL